MRRKISTVRKKSPIAQNEYQIDLDRYATNPESGAKRIIAI
jgi:hypothetical protein